MDNKKNINEILDPDIQARLKVAGLIPPQTIIDYEELEKKLKKKPLKKPAKLKDPYAFLERESKVKIIDATLDNVKKYEQNLAQAAREGKLIPEHIRQKMKTDKKNSKQSDG